MDTILVASTIVLTILTIVILAYRLGYISRLVHYTTRISTSTTTTTTTSTHRHPQISTFIVQYSTTLLYITTILMHTQLMNYIPYTVIYHDKKVTTCMPFVVKSTFLYSCINATCGIYSSIYNCSITTETCRTTITTIAAAQSLNINSFIPTTILVKAQLQDTANVPIPNYTFRIYRTTLFSSTYELKTYYTSTQANPPGSTTIAIATTQIKINIYIPATTITTDNNGIFNIPIKINGSLIFSTTNFDKVQYCTDFDGLLTCTTVSITNPPPRITSTTNSIYYVGGISPSVNAFVSKYTIPALKGKPISIPPSIYSIRISTVSGHIPINIFIENVVYVFAGKSDYCKITIITFPYNRKTF